MLRGLMRLEERIVLDGSGDGDNDGGDRMVVVDHAVEGADLLASAASGKATVVDHDSRTDSLDGLLGKMKEAREGMDTLAAIGFAGQLSGEGMPLAQDGVLSLAALTDDPGQAAFWSEVAGMLPEDGEIDILAEGALDGPEGEEMREALEELTGHAVSAGDNAAKADMAWLAETSGVHLDGDYFDSDFLAEYSFLSAVSPMAYTPAGFVFPSGNSLEIQENGSVLDWNQFFQGNPADFASDVFKFTMESGSPTNILQAFDWSSVIKFYQNNPSVFSSFQADSGGVQFRLASTLNGSELAGLVAAFNQVTAMNESAWNGALFKITYDKDGLGYPASSAYSLSLLPTPPNDHGEPSTPPPVEAPTVEAPTELGESLADAPAEDATAAEGFDIVRDRDEMLEWEEVESGMAESYTDLPLELAQLPDLAESVAAELSVEMQDVSVGMQQLNKSISVLLEEFSSVDPEVAEAVRPAIGQIAMAAQEKISVASRLVSLVSDAAQEWHELPVDQRDGNSADRMATFTENLLETNATVWAAMEGIEAARECLSRTDVPDADTLVALVQESVAVGYDRIRAELERRDSLFYERELLQIRQGKIASAGDDASE